MIRGTLIPTAWLAFAMFVPVAAILIQTGAPS